MNALDWLESRMMFGIKAGLGNIQAICARLGNPERSFRSIHVVGTNGKGSTAFWIMNILEAHGVRTGLFTSPHLVSVRERIRLGNTVISQDELEKTLERVRSTAGSLELTYFEVLTAVAFLWFAQQGVEVAVLEAGMGGRLDSTNAAHSEIVALTSIGLDHTEYLGNTLKAILEEKLGVWEPGALLLHTLDDSELQAEITAYPVEGRALWVDERPGIVVPHRGAVYRRNASLAWEAAREYLGVQFEDAVAGVALREAVWVGRVQELRGPDGKLEWILDGAHNGHAAQQLALTLAELGEPVTLVFACLQTKNPQEILEPLLPFVRKAIFTRTEHPKMREAGEHLEWVRAGVLAEVFGNYRDALTAARLEPGVRLVTGSLYFVGAVVGVLCGEYDCLSNYKVLVKTSNEL